MEEITNNFLPVSDQITGRQVVSLILTEETSTGKTPDKTGFQINIMLQCNIIFKTVFYFEVNSS